MKTVPEGKGAGLARTEENVVGMLKGHNSEVCMYMPIRWMHH